MNAAGRKVFGSMLVALRSVDPAAAERLQAAAVAPDKANEPNTALLLTQAQTARSLGFSRWTVRNLVKDGILHPVSIRGAQRYRRAEVEALAGGAV